MFMLPACWTSYAKSCPEVLCSSGRVRRLPWTENDVSMKGVRPDPLADADADAAARNSHTGEVVPESHSHRHASPGTEGKGREPGPLGRRHVPCSGRRKLPSASRCPAERKCTARCGYARRNTVPGFRLGECKTALNTLRTSDDGGEVYVWRPGAGSLESWAISKQAQLLHHL